MSDQSPQTSEISKFFSDYTRPFDARDGATIATFYHAPSITMRADASVHVFQTRRELQEFFQGVAEKYYAEGQRCSRFVNLDVKPIGSKSVLASLEWQMLREDGSTIRTWRQSYNLIWPDGRWQILVSTIHI
jgi:ketosteroid isomerase-like protein